MSVRILVAESDALLQSLLVEILGREDGFEIVGRVGTIPEALEAVAQLKPQVLLLDLDLMGAGSVKVLKTLGEIPDAPSVLALSGDDNEDTQLEAIENGVCGFLPKSEGAAALPQAIRALAHGELWFSPQLSVRIFREYHQLVRRFRAQERPTNQLSAREREVLQLVARGMTNNQIARDLFMSIHTVKLHVQNILRKLNLPNRTEAAVFAVKEGLLDTCS